MKPFYTNLIANEIITDGDYYYAINGIGNKLYKIKVDNLEVVSSCEINNDRDQDYLLYMHGVRCGNKLYYAPHAANSIGIYNIQNNSMSSIECEDLTINKSLGAVNGKYTYSFAYNNSIYFLGFNVPAIMKLDLKRTMVTYVSVPENVKENYNGWGYFSQGVVSLEKDVFLIPMGCEGCLMRLDTIKDEVDLVAPSFANEISGIGGLAVDSKGIVWLTSRNTKENKLISWDSNRDIYNVYDFNMQIRGYGTYYAPIVTKDYIYVFPESIDHIYRLSVHSNKMEIVEGLDNLINTNKSSRYFGSGIVGLRKIGDKVVFFTCYDYAFNDYDLLTEIGRKRFIDIGCDNKLNYLKMITDKGYITEPELDLKGFIDSLNQGIEA